MIRSVKEITVRAFHSDTVRALHRHVADYLAVYRFAKRVNALRWKTPVKKLQAV